MGNVIVEFTEKEAELVMAYIHQALVNHRLRLSDATALNEAYKKISGKDAINFTKNSGKYRVG
jgi:hypothetical protein